LTSDRHALGKSSAKKLKGAIVANRTEGKLMTSDVPECGRTIRHDGGESSGCPG